MFKNLDKERLRRRLISCLITSLARSSLYFDKYLQVSNVRYSLISKQVSVTFWEFC